MGRDSSVPSVIVVNKVSKTFRLPRERLTSIKSVVFNLFRRRRFESQKALQDISFEVKRGDFLGIVGRNGSGKSTLLKLLAGIYAPTRGDVVVNGKLTPFIELGVGFNQELTGRENVFLNGALLGFSRKEMLALYDDIVAFAELERFMDQKLKNYSSGMQVRLAFSIAIRAKADILLIDEVLAVGDAAFQRKCFEHFASLKKSDTTVILVTHDMSAVERFCNKALVIDGGKSHGVVSPAEATITYSRLNALKDDQAATDDNGTTRWGTGGVTITSLRVLPHKASQRQLTVNQGEKLILEIETSSKTTQPIVVGLAFIDQFGVNIAGPNSTGRALKSNSKLIYEVQKLPLAAGSYDVTVAIFDADVVEEFDHYEKALTMIVLESHKVHGKVDLFGSWSQQ